MDVRLVTFSIVFPYGAFFIIFEKIALALVLLCGRALIRVELDVLSKQCLHLETKCPVQFGDFHFTFYV